MFTKDIGIDLGTASVLIYVRGRGIIVHEPCVVAVTRDTGEICGLGEVARQMIGRTPGSIVAIRPLKNGVIADYDITERMLAHFIKRICGRRRLFRPRLVICVPSGVTDVEKRAVLEAGARAGARKVYLVSEPMAAAIGAGVDVSEASGNMVVDVGGGTTDICVISLGGEVVSDSIRIGGDNFDEMLMRYVRREYNLVIGERTAEEIKINVGTALPEGEERCMEVRGRDAVTGLPRSQTINSQGAYSALEEPVTAILDAVKGVLEKTPPELSSDVMDKGIVMTGGGALLHGLPALVSKHTGIPVHVPENPISCVAKGTGKVLDSIGILKGEVIVANR